MQKNIIIKTADKNFNIYGTLDKAANSSSLIIFVHGLTGHKNEHQFYNAASFFNRHDLSTFRFDLYSDEPGARSLENCSISTHTEDLGCVIEYFNKKFKNIYLVGHSIGGPTILGGNFPSVKKIVLWDPSTRLPKSSWCRFNKKLDAFIVSWGVSFIISKNMIHEWQNLNYSRWIKNCTVPLKIICAGKGELKNGWREVIKEFDCKKELITIGRASHCFNEEGVEETLFNETLKWLK